MTLRLQVPRPLALSGRPEPGEYASYSEVDFGHVLGDDAVSVLTASAGETLALYAMWTDDDIGGLTYAPGKWTVKEILGHLADDERIFAYRALAIARGDATEMPGFDEKLYVSTADFEERPLASLLEEYRSVRQASLTLFASLSLEAFQRRGVVNGYSASPRGLAFHIAAHEQHHLRTLRELYLPCLQ